MAELEEQVRLLVRSETSLLASQQDLDRELRIYRKLHELDARLDSRFSVQTILQQIALFATRELGYQRSVLLLDDRNTGVFTVRASDGYFTDDWRKRLTGTQITASEPFLTPLRGGLRIASRAHTTEAEEARVFGRGLGLDCFLAFPILGLTKNLLGILVVGNTNAEEHLYVPVDEHGPSAASLARLAEKGGWAINTCTLNWDLAIERNLLESKITERTQELQRAYEQIQEDLAHARDFQQSILSAPPNLSGLDIDVVYRPCELVGGDIYDISHCDGRVQVFLADAVGHGVGASLTTMFIKSEYDMARRLASQPAAVLRSLNDEIAGRYGRLEMRFTAICVDLDFARGSLTYATACHPAPCVLKSGRVEDLESGGPFMGVIPGVEFPEWTVPFDAGDGLFLYTDGIFEEWNADGEEFGETRVHQAIMAAVKRGERAGAAACSALEEFVGGRALKDDLTFVGIRWLGSAST